MEYTISQVIEEVEQQYGEVRKGTVEAFRAVLQKKGVLGKNKLMGQKEVDAFKKVCQMKDDSNTWVYCMEKAVQEEYGEDLVYEHHWTTKSKLKHLKWLIETGKVTSVPYLGEVDNNKEYWHAMYEIVLENLVDLGKIDVSFDESFYTDNNPCTYVLKGKDFTYYLFGKLNHVTKKEGVVIYYNDGLEFNIMRCDFVAMGPTDEGIIGELVKAIRKQKEQEKE